MALSDNQALNAIFALVGKIEKSVRNGYTTLSGQQYVVSLADPLNRPAMPTCVRAVVTNLGPNPVRISEAGKLVCASLAVNATWVSPTSGAGTIKVDTAGAGSTISLANYLLN